MSGMCCPICGLDGFDYEDDGELAGHMIECETEDDDA